MIEKELPAVKGALELMGYMTGSVKIAIVICQKGHHTRLVYDEAPAGGSYNIRFCKWRSYLYTIYLIYRIAKN